MSNDNTALLSTFQVIFAIAAVVVFAAVMLAKRRLDQNNSNGQNQPISPEQQLIQPQIANWAADSGSDGRVTATALPAPATQQQQVQAATATSNATDTALQIIRPEDYEWWRVVVERAPHVLLVGDNDSGKTTTARALAKERSYLGKVLVIDPNATPDRWGIPAIGAGHQFGDISQAMSVLNKELSRRYAERARGITDHEPITIVVDEMNLIVKQCGEIASTFLGYISRSGREAKMKLLVLAQSDRVKALGIEGEGDIRDQFATIRLGYKARERFPKELANVERPAALLYKAYDGPVSVFFMMLYEQMEFEAANIMTLEDLLSSNNDAFQNRGEIIAQSVKNYVETSVSEPKQISGVSSPETAVETSGNALAGFSRNDFLAAAKLIRANAAGETKILETLFKVKPGGSAAYQEARQRLREAIEELEKQEGR